MPTELESNRIRIITVILFIIFSVVWGVIWINLYAPVTIDLQTGQHSSAAFIPGARVAEAKMILEDDSVLELECDDTKCSVTNQQLEEGSYLGYIEVRNLLGMLLQEAKFDLTIDNTPPELSLDYPRYTNSLDTSITINSEPGALIRVDQIEVGTFVDTVQHQVTLPGEEGIATIYEVTAEDSSGNQTVKQAEIIYDNSIDLTISSPKAGAVVGTSFTIKGKTEPNAVVKANGKTTRANDKGEYSFKVPYRKNTFTVTAKDQAGNTVSKSRSIKRKVTATATTSSGSVSFPSTSYCNSSVIKAYWESKASITWISVRSGGDLVHYKQGTAGPGNCWVFLTKSTSSCSVAGWITGPKTAVIAKNGQYLAETCGAVVL